MKKLFIYSSLLVALASCVREETSSTDTANTVSPKSSEVVSEQTQVYVDTVATEAQQPIQELLKQDEVASVQTGYKEVKSKVSKRSEVKVDETKSQAVVAPVIVEKTEPMVEQAVVTTVDEAQIPATQLQNEAIVEVPITQEPAQSESESQIKEEKEIVDHADEYKPTMQYKDYMFLNNGAYGSLNPTFMRDLPLEQLAILQVSYGAGMGDFHKLDKSGDIRDLLVEVYGVKKLESVSFEGGMSYRNGKEKQRRWNSTLYQAEDNPFILADSVFSDYTVEQFTLDGRFSWEPLDLLRFGINALYEVGATSDEQDPRLETKGMRFTINPGIDFKVSKHVKIGATGGVRLFNENSRYSTVETAINSSFFVMKGFGLSLNNGGTSYQRETKGTAWFAALQVYLNRPGYTNFLNGGIEQNREKAIDGGTTQQFVGGEYRNCKIFVNDRFSFTRNKYMHNIEVLGEYDKVEGIWYDQKYITNLSGQSYWETKLKSIIYTQDLWQAALKYRFDVLNEGNTPSWTLSAGVKYANSDIKNYPDGYKQSYQNLYTNLSLSKHFSIKKAVLSLSALGNYMVNLNTGLLLGDDIELKDKYTIPMYNYITSDSYSVQGRIETKIPIISKRFTSYIGAYVEASTQRYVGNDNMFRLTHFNRFGGGINYSF